MSAEDSVGKRAKPAHEGVTAKEIRVVLLDGNALEPLLAGMTCVRVWLTDNGDGTYGLHAQIPGTKAGRDRLRLFVAEHYRASGSQLSDEGKRAVAAEEAELATTDELGSSPASKPSSPGPESRSERSPNAT